MAFNQFHFAETDWLWGLLVIPLIWGLYGFFFHPSVDKSRMEGFIDAHLLPHLMISKSAGESNLWQSIAIASLLWALLIGGLAGPRWDFKEVATFTSDQSLIVLLDLSQSMNADDVKPTRLARARQEIEDIMNLAKGVKIGLVAYAADAHMISPLTDDMQTIRHLLPSLDTDLVYIQGSNLAPALDMATNLLTAEPGKNKSILVVTDGGFNDVSASIAKAKQLRKQGIILDTLGIGTKVGAPIRDAKGAIIKQDGSVVMSHLEQDKLQEIGQYISANYTENDSKRVLNQLKSRVQAEKNKQQKTRHWEERFYLLIVPLMLIMLLGFRQGFVFPVLLIVCMLPVDPTQAATLEDYFKNGAQLGQEAMTHKEYDKASSAFKDAYRKGVAQYKAGNFAEAERLFAESKRSEVQDKALYNLGNALSQQKKFEPAISAYEKVLAHDADNEKAKENLALVKKLLEQQKNKDKQQQDKQKNKENKEKQEDKQKNQDKQGAGNSESDKQDQSEKQQKNKAQDKKDNSASDNKSDEKKKQENKPDSDKKAGEQKPDSAGKKAAEEQDDKNEQAQPQSAEQKPAEGTDEKKAVQANEDEQHANKKPAKTQADIDADQWLNRAKSDPKLFLKNQFYIESKRNQTKQESKPW